MAKCSIQQEGYVSVIHVTQGTLCQLKEVQIDSKEI